jgi:hypothetical protein
MAKNEMNIGIWPSKLGEKDYLYALVDREEQVHYLIFQGDEQEYSLVRDNGNWVRLNDTFFRDIDDEDLFNYDVPVDFIRYYDAITASGVDPFPYENLDENPVVAAAPVQPPKECPPATSDISLNLKNRQKAIDSAGYGPLNPALPNDEFWQEKADMWSVPVDEATQSLCGNCAVFIITNEMRRCIAAGLEQGGSGEQNAWDAIDVAELGYCEAFDFKCAASRTCDAWVAGGPVKDKVQSNRGV